MKRAARYQTWSKGSPFFSFKERANKAGRLNEAENILGIIPLCIRIESYLLWYHPSGRMKVV